MSEQTQIRQKNSTASNSRSVNPGVSQPTSDVPPQIIIIYRGQKRALGRQSVKQMGYKRFVSTMLKQFGLLPVAAKEEDLPGIINTTDGTTSTLREIRREFFAIINTVDPEDCVPTIVLDDNSWGELVDNILRLELSVGRPARGLLLDITMKLGNERVAAAAGVVLRLALTLLILVVAIIVLYLPVHI